MLNIESKLSELETEVMNSIWNFDKMVSVRDIVDHKYPNGEKAYTTVQTVMNNLVDKGYLSKEKIGLVNFYTPIIEKQDVVSFETRSFIEKFFNGSSLNLANFLINSKELSYSEIEELRDLIDSAKDD